MQQLFFIAALLTAIGPACFPRVHSAAPTPEQIEPTPTRPPPAPIEGHGQVTFDADQPETRVSLVTSRISATSLGHVQGSGLQSSVLAGTGQALLCRTPCTANVPIGDHDIHFLNDRGSYVGTIYVGPDPSAMRVNVHRYEPVSGFALWGPLALFSLGTLAMLGSSVVIATGELETGLYTLGAGGGVMIFSMILGAFLWRDDIYPGSHVHWETGGGFYQPSPGEFRF